MEDLNNFESIMKTFIINVFFSFTIAEGILSCMSENPKLIQHMDKTTCQA